MKTLYKYFQFTHILSLLCLLGYSLEKEIIFLVISTVFFIVHLCFWTIVYLDSNFWKSWDELEQEKEVLKKQQDEYRIMLENIVKYLNK